VVNIPSQETGRTFLVSRLIEGFSRQL